MYVWNSLQSNVILANFLRDETGGRLYLAEVWRTTVVYLNIFNWVHPECSLPGFILIFSINQMIFTLRPCFELHSLFSGNGYFVLSMHTTAQFIPMGMPFSKWLPEATISTGFSKKWIGLLCACVVQKSCAAQSTAGKVVLKVWLLINILYLTALCGFVQSSPSPLLFWVPRWRSWLLPSAECIK